MNLPAMVLKIALLRGKI